MTNDMKQVEKHVETLTEYENRITGFLIARSKDIKGAPTLDMQLIQYCEKLEKDNATLLQQKLKGVESLTAAKKQVDELEKKCLLYAEELVENADVVHARTESIREWVAKICEEHGAPYSCIAAIRQMEI